MLETSKVIEKYGRKAAATDAAICMGSVAIDHEYISENNTLIGRSCFYWLSDNRFLADEMLVSSSGALNYGSTWDAYGVRPVLKSYNLKNVIKSSRMGFNGTKEVKFGEFPQYVANKSVQKKLEQLYNDSSINKTGKTYSDFGEEYELDGHKYVRISKYISSSKTLSDGNGYFDSIVWLEVKPIIWLIDEENDMLISKYILTDKPVDKFGFGVPFKKSDLYKYLNNEFIKEINPSRHISHTREKSASFDYALEEHLSLDDNLNNNYTEEDLKIDRAHKSAMVVELAKTASADYPKVREFVKKLGNEYLAVFDEIHNQNIVDQENKTNGKSK